MENNNKLNIPKIDRDVIPLLITKELERNLKSHGVTDAEINKLTPKEAWELLQQKILKDNIVEPNKEKVYTLEDIERESDILFGLWDDAFERMYETSSFEKANEIYEITSFNYDDVLLERYLVTEAEHLSPEEKYFVQMSINIKKFKARAKVLLYGEQK